MHYDLLLLNVRRQYHVHEQNFGDFLGIHILASFLAENGYQARTFVGYAHQVEKVLQNEIKAHGVRVVGFYCDYDNQTEVALISSFIKDHYQLPVIIGGPQAVALGKDFLMQSRCDVVVRGEGELTLLELMNHLLNGSGRLGGINGITFLNHNNELIVSPDQPLIKNLDVIPLVDSQYSLNQNFRQKTAAFLTGRGCPFSCAFCYEGHNTKSVRFRSVDNVMQEIDRVLESSPNIKYLLFTDDTFTLNLDRVQQFCTELAKRRQKRDFVWFCEGHVRTLAKHPEMIPMMVEAGMVRLQIGLESGSQKVLDLYHKQTTLAEIEFVINECVKHRVPQVVANIILGGAGETETTLRESWDFAERILTMGAGMLDLRTVYFWPFPNTTMTTNPQDFGMRIIDAESLTSMGDYPVVEMPGLSREELCSWKQRFDQHIISTMRNLKNAVSYRQVLRQYQAFEKYQADSIWLSIFNEEAFIHKYFSFLARGAAKRSADIKPVELLRYHPIRTVELIEHNQAGCLRVAGVLLSRLETEVIRHCAGKLSLQQLADKLYAVFSIDCSGTFLDQNEFQSKVIMILKTFEERYWLLYSRF